jgi:diphosphomevalonate decarboxylase
MATFEHSGGATARAGANFALVKYWGKADARLNVPAVGSISITLDSLFTETEVELTPAQRSDELVLDGKRRDEDLAKISACVDLLRRTGVDTRVRVVSRNNFPTGAGLASSASGFAALVRAAEAAFGLALSPRERSIFARQGSGSAARSIFGGFVEMHAGTAADGNDSFAEPLLEGKEWPLEVVIAVTSMAEKEIGSRSGMTRSATSSPYYAALVAGQPPDLATARAAIRARDFAALADVAEQNCLKMHAAALAAQPPLVYWNGATVECLHAVRRLRAGGVPVFFTIDAGPQLKAVCAPGARTEVERTLRAVPGVLELLTSALGPGAELR